MSEQELIRKAQAEYRKQWRRNNPEKTKAHQERYWLKKAQQLKEQQEVKADNDTYTTNQ